MNQIHQSWTDHCNSMYPREFGHPVRIKSPIANDRQLTSTIERWQDKGDPAYVTVYSFSDWDRRPKSAIFDRVFLDLDHDTKPQLAIDEAIRLIEGLNDQHDIKTTQYFSGKKGVAVYIDFNPVPIADENKKDVLAMFQKILKRIYNLTTLDMHVVGDINRISRLPNTLHQSSGLHCIPITLDQMHTGIDEIMRMARSPCTDTSVVRHQNRTVRTYMLDYEQAVITKHKFEQQNAWMRGIRIPSTNPGGATREDNIINSLIDQLNSGGLDHKRRVGLVWLMDDVNRTLSEIIDVFMTVPGADRSKTEYQVKSILEWKKHY